MKFNDSKQHQKLSENLDTEFFKALADQSRLDILLALALSRDEQTVSAIAECCPQSLSVVSRHLRTLRDGGIVSAQKRGKEVNYQLCTSEVVRRLRNLADALEQCCPQANSGAEKCC